MLAALGCADVAGGRESAIWFSLPEVDGRYTVEAEQSSNSVTLPGPGSLLLSRVGTEARRPGQADQLAVDLWIDGHHVVVDPGSYRCTAPLPWGNALTGIEAHATLLQVGETVAKVGQFLRMTMPDGRVASCQMLAGDVEVVVGDRREAGLGRLRRSLVRVRDCYLVVDEALGVDAQVRWNLDVPAGLKFRLLPSGSAATSTPVDSDPASVWVSPLYGLGVPCPATVVTLADGAA